MANVPHPNEQMSLGELRNYYEHQGEDFIRRGERISCSDLEMTEALLKMVRSRHEPLRTLLDVGCGANLTYDVELAAEGRTIIGVEFAASFLRMAPRHPSIPLIQASGDALPIADSTMDGVICSETLEHVPSPHRFVDEIFRVLKPNGLLFLTVPNLWNAHRLLTMLRRLDFSIQLMPGHLREYTTGTARQLLGNQFELLHVHPVGFGFTGFGVGGIVERLIQRGLLNRLSKSHAFTARARKSS